MKLAQILLALAMAVVLGIPFAIRAGSSSPRPAANAQTLIVITPHVQQIQVEFARAFARWYDREHPDGPPARLDFRQPGGTSDILRQLRAQYAAAAKNPDLFDPETLTFTKGAIPADVLFGGGSYDHDLLKKGIEIRLDPADPDAMIDLFEPILRRSRQASSALIADSRGREFLILQRADRWQVRLMRRDEWGDEARWIEWSDANPTRITRTESLDYDPRTRPWWHGALQSRLPVPGNEGSVTASPDEIGRAHV